MRTSPKIKIKAKTLTAELAQAVFGKIYPLTMQSKAPPNTPVKPGENHAKSARMSIDSPLKRSQVVQRGRPEADELLIVDDGLTDSDNDDNPDDGAEPWKEYVGNDLVLRDLPVQLSSDQIEHIKKILETAWNSPDALPGVKEVPLDVEIPRGRKGLLQLCNLAYLSIEKQFSIAHCRDTARPELLDDWYTTLENAGHLVGWAETISSQDKHCRVELIVASNTGTEIDKSVGEQIFTLLKKAEWPIYNYWAGTNKQMMMIFANTTKEAEELIRSARTTKLLDLNKPAKKGEQTSNPHPYPCRLKVLPPQKPAAYDLLTWTAIHPGYEQQL